jgi:hypothetical protein
MDRFSSSATRLQLHLLAAVAQFDRERIRERVSSRRTIGSVRRRDDKGLDQDVPFECKTSSLKTETGVVTVPTGPGSGIEIDPAFSRKPW